MEERMKKILLFLAIAFFATMFISSQAQAILTADFAWNPQQGVVNQPIKFTGYPTGATGAFTYLWDFGDGATSTANPVTHTFTTANTYQVVLKTTDAVPSTVTTIHSVTVHTTLAGAQGTFPVLLVLLYVLTLQLALMGTYEPTCFLLAGLTGIFSTIESFSFAQSVPLSTLNAASAILLITIGIMRQRKARK
jgi:PKD repeat protein